MQRASGPNILRELLKPLGQILVFVLGSSLVLSAFILILALLFRGSAVDKDLLAKNGVDIFTYTLANLPQVLLDGVTIGFVYAAIALGYTMV